MSKFLDELLSVRSSGAHAPAELERTVIEQGGELRRLRAIVSALCTVLVDRGLCERDELLHLLRNAIHDIDPLMLPSLRRATAATGPLGTASANPYREGTAGERQVTCIRCARSVQQKHTNLTDDGPICDTCWEPRI